MNLQDLPAEILDEITFHLPYTALVALRWTSRSLHNDIYCPLPLHWHIHQQYNNPAARLAARDARFPFRTLDGKIDCDERSVLRQNAPAEKETMFTTKKPNLTDQVIPETPPRRPTRDELRRCMFDLLILESYPYFNTSALARVDEYPQELLPKIIPAERYACHTCLKLLPQSRFSRNQIRGDRTRGRTSIKVLLERQAKTDYYDSSLPVEQRYCIPCGISDGKYAAGVFLQWIEEETIITGEAGKCGAKKLVLKSGIVCKGCRKWQVCEGGQDSKCAVRRLCEKCLADKLSITLVPSFTGGLCMRDRDELKGARIHN
jgi:hypothetical protein